MDKVQQDYTTWLGNTKRITPPDEDGFVMKYFKTKEQSIPIEEQRKIIEMKKKYFGEYIPETQLIEILNGAYVIRQKFIDGKTLAKTDISSLSASTLEKILDLIKKYLKYHKEQGGDMDITGYQYYGGNPSKLGRMIRNFLKINKNFLTSTNIMISKDGNVFMVDVCESSDISLQGKIKNFLAKPFIKKTISDLEKALKRRINFENESINQKLLNTLAQ